MSETRSPEVCVECDRRGCTKCDHKNVERRKLKRRVVRPSGEHEPPQVPYLSCRCRCCGEAWTFEIPLGQRAEDFGPLS